MRTAIVSGELSGKLPGERVLARRFRVNAKTLSKALTDLAAEGLLDRSIGRGTFVHGAAAPPVRTDRWVILCDPDQLDSPLLAHLREFNDDLQVVSDTSVLRPSFLNSCKAVIDLSMNTPDAFLRDLVVRNIPVVLLGREPTTYSVNTVLVDRALGASCLARDMMLAGHRHFLAVERKGQTAVVEAIRQAALRCAPDATADSVYPAQIPSALQQQNITAIICDSRSLAVHVRQVLQRQQIAIPQQISLAAIGSVCNECPCSGYFVDARQKAHTAVQLIRNSGQKRPAVVWLAGRFIDRGTIAPLPAAAARQAQASSPQFDGMRA